ncbi:MAG: hypothetical protein ACOCVC_01470 [Spirochaeta sp.]
MKIPIVQRKNVGSLREGDRLLMDAGVSVRAGQPADEKTVAFLLRHRCTTVPVIQGAADDPARLQEQVSALQGPFHTIRMRLTEKLKNTYTPYHETDSSFCVKGKKKQITDGILFERDPGPLYQPDIDAGSESILPLSDITYLQHEISSLYDILEKMTYRSPEQKPERRTIPRIHLESIRIGTQFSGDRVAFVGDALPWHCVDTAIWFLVTIINMNKERLERGIPYSDSRFDPNSNTVISDEVRYRPEIIQSATLGILLHGIGLAHRDVHQLLCSMWTRAMDTGRYPRIESLPQSDVRLLQKQYFSTRNLFRNRDDIPPIARMMINLQYDYPDLTGYPAPFENRFLHEFVRLFHVIDTYDSLINPIFPMPVCQKYHALEFIRNNSGSYAYSAEGYRPSPRFDYDLYRSWLNILSPYSRYELLQLSTPGFPESKEYTVQVHSYGSSHLPVFSIRQDQNQRRHSFGSLLLSMDHNMLMSIKDGQVQGKKKLPGADEMIITEPNIGTPEPAADPLYSGERNLSRNTSRL